MSLSVLRDWGRTGFESGARCLDALTHASARNDALVLAEHRGFIAPRIFCGLLTFALLPFWLALRGAPTPQEFGVIALVTAPLLAVSYLAQTGRLNAAHIVSIGIGGLVVLALPYFVADALLISAVWLFVLVAEASAARTSHSARITIAMTGGIAAMLAAQTAFLGVSSAIEFWWGAPPALLYAAALGLCARRIDKIKAARLHRSQSRYPLVARNTSDLITRHGRNGSVTDASPAAQSLLGSPPEALFGQGLFDRVLVSDRPLYRHTLAQAYLSNEEHRVELRVRQDSAFGNGRVIAVEMRCRASVEVERNEREVIATLRDISQDRNLAEERARAQALANHATAAKRHFLAMISHELRTPLNTIIGFSELIINEESLRIDAKSRRDYSKLINQSGHHLLDVINGMLDASKIESDALELELKPVSLSELMNHCCDLVALKARDAHVDLVLRIANGLPDIQADKRACKQIILNLVSNAIKFRKTGGRVILSLKREADHLAMGIEDDGIGISEADLARLGEPFFQARNSYDRPYEGSGLGLSIVKGLVQSHGGHIAITSRPDAGTRVIVRFPLPAAREPAAPGIADAQQLSESTPIALRNKERKRA